MAESVASREEPERFKGGSRCECKTSFLACEMESDFVILVMFFVKIAICLYIHEW